MSQSTGAWYVRLPDGRVLRAASTNVVLRHLDSGRIPSESRVRRSPAEEWMALDWTEEFADLVRQRAEERASRTPPPPAARPVAPRSFLQSQVAARYDPKRIQTIGLRGLAEELIAALDNTLGRLKLLIAGVLAVSAALVWAVLGNVHMPDQTLWLMLPPALAIIIVFGLGTVANVLLTQATYTELSRLRPATWAEARTGLLVYWWRLCVCLAVAGGGIGGLLIAIHHWSAVDLAASLAPRFREEITAPAISVAMLLFEFVLWAVLPFTLLLGPVIVVEEASIPRSLAQWWWMVRRHLGRLLLYESAAVVAGIAMLAFALPLGLAAWSRWSEWGRVDTATGIGLLLLGGLAAAPLIAYFAVAHVFIYLNLRYQSDDVS